MKSKNITINETINLVLNYDTLRVDFLTKQITIESKIGMIPTETINLISAATLFAVRWTEGVSTTLNNITQVDIHMRDNSALEEPIHSIVLQGEFYN